MSTKKFELMAQGRSLWGQVFKNFIASIKPRKHWGELRGKDYLGTQYFESPKSLQGNRRPSRWFTPAKEDNFQQKIPPEWEAWLRHRRRDPPTEEEIQINLLKRQQLAEKVKLLEKPKCVNEEEIFKTPEFPTYEEYTMEPDKEEKTKQR